LIRQKTKPLIMRKLFICLANSKKYNERCIAGIEVTQRNAQEFLPVMVENRPKWIRPVTNSEHGEVPTKLVDKLKMLAVYEVDIVRDCPKGYQSENALFYQPSLKKIKVLENVELKHLEWIADQESNQLFFGKGKAISKDFIHKVNHSLCLIKAEKVKVYGKKYREWEIPKPRVAFDYQGNRYDLSITDIAFLKAYENDKSIIEKAQHVFITVSLGAEHEGWFYKIAAGIICI